ncbi:MAG: hypothetical protein GEU83_15605 [Pseudonocardiaceae bacterium]|nr:hypothetical protein [Pseudonocardiaceae bacterium]
MNEDNDLFGWSRRVTPAESSTPTAGRSLTRSGCGPRWPRPGWTPDTVLIVPSLTEACEPMVYLTTVTSAAERRLAHILGGGAAPPPRGPGGRSAA